MIKLLELKLYFITRVILRRHKPRIIAVVGSVGKTSAKEAIYRVLASTGHVRKAEGSYNNEIGVPLTIIGSKAQGKNVFGWMSVFMKSVLIMLGVIKYPETLVLEFGEGKPGDIAYLMKLVEPEVVVLTSIDNVHIEFFKSIDGVTKEIGSAIKMLKQSGKAIVNYDNEHLASLVSSGYTSVVKIGMSEKVDMRAEDIRVTTVDDALGLSMKVSYQGHIVPVFLPGVPAYHQVYAVLAASAVGIHFSMNLVDIGKELRLYKQPKGRTNLIKGIHDSMLIDDTYNASPVAANAALDIFAKMPLTQEAKKIAVFGEMLELGKFSEEGHASVGRKAYEVGIDTLVTVGPLARTIIKAACEAGLHESSVKHFNDKKDAIIYLQETIAKNDVALIKGSQGSRMEHVVKLLMENPRDAEKLLVRQSSEWLKKK